jgi:hypothetical protein
MYLYQSFIKTAINTAITVKLLTSKVTLLEYSILFYSIEKRLDLGLGNIKSKVNEICYCETCLSQLGLNAEADAEPSGSTEQMRNEYGDKMRNGYGDKMRHNEFFASFLRYCVFYLCFIL